RHLGKQTAKRIGLVDFVAVKRGEADERLARERAAGAEIVSLDVLDPETLVAAGRLVWEHGGERLFAIGSQGFEAALVAYWRSAGLIPAQAAPHRAPAVERIAAVSGSVSPITAAQIAFSLQNGFAGVPLPGVERARSTPGSGRARSAAPPTAPSRRSGKGATRSSTPP